MNLIEAHKSGRRWRRQGWYGKEWYKVLTDDGNSYGSNDSVVAYETDERSSDEKHVLDAEDILAEDYILEPEAKRLTRDEVEGAVVHSLQNHTTAYGDLLHVVAHCVSDILFKDNLFKEKK